MCKLTLNAVITKALVDERFREALLARRSEAALGEFSLGEEERRVLDSIQANDLRSFVAQMHHLMREDASGWLHGVEAGTFPLSRAYAVAGD